MQVTKRSGELQTLDISKIHAVLDWACNGYADSSLSPIRGVSVSQIEMKAQLHFYDKMPTTVIHNLLIQAASSLISEDTPNYDHVAARLVWFSVRKEAFGENTPPHLYEVVKSNVDLGWYTPELLDMYTEEEFDTINSFIVHSRDDLFRYAGAVQARQKYLVQNRKTRQLYESFQFPYILAASILFADYPKSTRLKYVKKYYDLTSQHFISLPTPIMAGLRTKEKQFSSCTLISSDDSLDSITSTASAIVKYASAKAGIGVDLGRIRAEGQVIRGGKAISTGILPFSKLFNAALKSCSQGAVRGASATFNFPGWHLEFERIVELKNEKGTDETRLRTVDYSIHLNRVFYERWASKGMITLFSPEEVPDLYKAFYSDRIDRFRELYIQYEKDPTKTKKQLPAEEFFRKLLTERFETSRIYILHADHVNTQSPFYDSVTQMNLCAEVLLPTVPTTSNPEEGRIALCTLSAVNMGKFGDLSTDAERKLLQLTCEMAVRGLDALLSYQDYPMKEAALSVEDYRPLGIGAIGLAHWLAKSFSSWSDPSTLGKVDHFMEHMAFYLIQASNTLAQEFGPTLKRTRYHDGRFPWDSSPLPACEKHLDWDGLRSSLRTYGIRNATLMAFMPSETSSQLSNETNGVEPPKSLVTAKGSKDGAPIQVVPEIQKLGHVYETAWDVRTKDYLQVMARIQRWTDQSISSNTTYDPKNYPKGLSLKDLAEDLLLSYSLGIKTLYYNNCNDSSFSLDDDDSCASGACKI